MSDISITAGNVVKSTGAQVNTGGFAGEAVTAGQAVYKKASDDKWWLSDSDLSAAAAEVRGVALHAAAADQPLAVQTGGDLTMGATLTKGSFYYVSNNAGGICLFADLGSADYVSLIGYAKTTAIMTIFPLATGVTI